MYCRKYTVINDYKNLEIVIKPFSLPPQTEPEKDFYIYYTIKIKSVLKCN